MKNVIKKIPTLDSGLEINKWYKYVTYIKKTKNKLLVDDITITKVK
jgi:hypothetical protein